MTRRTFLSFVSVAALAVTTSCASSRGSVNRRRVVSRRAQVRQARIDAIQARRAAMQQKNAVVRTAQGTVKAGQNLLAGVLQTIGKLW